MARFVLRPNQKLRIYPRLRADGYYLTSDALNIIVVLVASQTFPIPSYGGGSDGTTDWINPKGYGSAWRRVRRPG